VRGIHPLRKSPPVVLAAVAALAAGCGGGDRSAAASVADCLNGYGGFLVQPSGDSVAGQAPSGLTFSLRLYTSPGPARAAAASKSRKTTAVAGRAVVDFGGNPGVPPPRLSRRGLSEIRACVRRATPK